MLTVTEHRSSVTDDRILPVGPRQHDRQGWFPMKPTIVNYSLPGWRFDYCPAPKGRDLRSRLSLAVSALSVSSQLVQQRLGLLQVFGVKPFGEPIIAICQRLSGFVLLTLLLPKAGKVG